MITLTRLGWGTENVAFRQLWTSSFIPEGTNEQWGCFNEMQRISASPENAARLEAQWGKINITEVLPQIRIPTIVFHCEGDHVVPLKTDGVWPLRFLGPVRSAAEL